MLASCDFIHHGINKLVSPAQALGDSLLLNRPRAMMDHGHQFGAHQYHDDCPRKDRLDINGASTA
jgi:hypothetical protein